MIVGGLATIPARVNTLEKVVYSIIPQVDLLYVVLNGHTSVPQWLKSLENVEYVVSNNFRGDAMKFIKADMHNVYYFGFDDDLIYPDNYVAKMKRGVDKYNGLVSLHGRTYPRPVESFTKWIGNYRCLNTVMEDMSVDVVGSGVCAFHTSRLKVKLGDFAQPNMADLYLSKLAHEQGVPMMVLQHPQKYLQYLNTDRHNTIWHTESKNRFERQTTLLKEFLK